MNVVGSARLEYFADGSNAGFFVRAIEAVDRLVVPAITLFEVLKRVCKQRGEGDAFPAPAFFGYPATAFLIASVSAGRTSNTSPTMP